MKKIKPVKKVKKTLVIPEWLNILALEHEINFSQTLIIALENELKEYIPEKIAQ
jgi:hypothetical protein